MDTVAFHYWPVCFDSCYVVIKPYGMCTLQVEAEKALLQLQQQFDSSLTELKSKAEMLSTRLDEEVANRKQIEAEVSPFRFVYHHYFHCL